MEASELGEFGLIERLAASVSTEQVPHDLIVGIGDDCAVWRAGDVFVLATTDTLVEGVHFPTGLEAWRDLGWKALAVNVSDIAAMGGEPLFVLVTVSLPPTTPVRTVDELYAGLQECAQEYRVTIAGGDIVSSSQLSITVALVGRAESPDGKPLLLLRSTARPDDSIAVTGMLGDSAAGRLRLAEGAAIEDGLVRAHLRPRPPLELAREAARLGFKCGIDISDGLLQDLGHICEMSGLAATVHANTVPLSSAIREAYPHEALRLATAGGEDYQMLLIAPRHLIDRLTKARPEQITVIGKMTAGEPLARLLDEAGYELDLGSAGWQHLRASARPNE